MSWKLWMLGAGLLALPLVSPAETIHLKNGKSIEGRVLSREAERVWLETDAGRVPLPLARVAEAKPETWAQAEEAFAMGENERALRLAQIVVFWEPEHEEALQLIRRAENQIALAQRGRELTEIEQLARETLERFEARLAEINESESDPEALEKALLQLEGALKTAAQNFGETSVQPDFAALTENVGRQAVEAHREQQRLEARKERERELETRRLEAEALGLRDFYAPVATLNNGGKAVELEKLMVPGGVMVFDFYADWSESCRDLEPHLRSLARSEDNVYLRRINILGWDTAVAQQFGLTSIPSVWVYDAEGEAVDTKLNAAEAIRETVRRAVEP